MHVHPAMDVGVSCPPYVQQEAGWEMAETMGASGPGVLCPCPSSAHGEGLPLPCSHGALLVHRVPVRLPALCQCHSQPQPPADSLPPDRQLVPELALTLCHGAWVRAAACPLPAHQRGCPTHDLHPCALWVHRRACPLHCVSLLTCVHMALGAVCHRVSACVGMDGSILCLSDHLWSPRLFPLSCG